MHQTRPTPRARTSFTPLITANAVINDIILMKRANQSQTMPGSSVRAPPQLLPCPAVQP